MIIQLIIQNFLFSQLSLFNPRQINKFDLGLTQVVENSPKYNYDSDILDINIQASSAIVVDASNGDILYERNIDEQKSIASITKLMTALVFLDQGIDMSTRVTIKSIDRQSGGIEHFFIGEVVRVADLLYSALIASDNDAAYALARSTGFTVLQYIDLMNNKAKELKMENTFFADPTGLDSKNVSTARDLVLLLQEVSKNTTLADATSRRSYVFNVLGIKGKEREIKLYSTDSLTSSKYLDLIAGKTGYIREAGYCLIAKIKSQNEKIYYIVALDSNDIQGRFQDVKALEYFVNNKFLY